MGIPRRGGAELRTRREDQRRPWGEHDNQGGFFLASP